MSLLLLLCISESAMAGPWWISASEAPQLSDSLDSLWPGNGVEIRQGQPTGADGIWWSDGALHLQSGGQSRSSLVPQHDLSTQVVLARSWTESVEVLDGGWVPPAVQSTSQLSRTRPLAAFARLDVSSTMAFEPTVSIGTGLAFQRARAGVRLSGGTLEGHPHFAVSALASAWLPVQRSALELGGGPGLVITPLDERLRLTPVATLQATLWAPDLDGNRVGIGISADVPAAPAPQLKDAFAIRAEVSWTFGPAQ